VYEVQLTADHVGPISLGFRHSAVFNALCISCNSAKNNRMSLADVDQLLDLQSAGVEIVSDHARLLWNECAPLVESDAGALLLSRVMRINQEMYLRALSMVAGTQVPVALVPRLQLELAAIRIVNIDFDVATLNVRGYEWEERQGTYARKRIERVLRVAFEALNGRADQARNLHLVQSEAFDHACIEVATAARALAVPYSLLEMNEWLSQLPYVRDGSLPAFRNIDELNRSASGLAAGINGLIEDAMEIAQYELITRFKSGDHRLLKRTC
jgi:hypothetical protein